MAIGASGDRVELLKSIAVPTLVIHGMEDPLVPIAGGRETASLIPHAVMLEIAGMGHDLPDQLADEITAKIAAHCHAAETVSIATPA